MKKLLFILIFSFVFIVGCSENKKVLKINKEDTLINLYEKESRKIDINYTEGYKILASSTNPDVAIFKDGYVLASNEGTCKITLYLSEEPNIKDVITVKVTKLKITSNLNNFDMYLNEEVDFILEATDNKEMIIEILDKEICEIKNNKLVALKTGNTKIIVKLKDYQDISIEINVMVKNYLLFNNAREYFGNEIKIINKKTDNYILLENEDNIKEFLDNVTLIRYIKYNEKVDLSKILYTIKANNNTIHVYENNILLINNEKFEIVSKNEVIYNFDFLSNYSYTIPNDEWLPWV